MPQPGCGKVGGDLRMLCQAQTVEVGDRACLADRSYCPSEPQMKVLTVCIPLCTVGLGPSSWGGGSRGSDRH